jgi:predicted PurR-regulated permease PerM
MEHKTYDVSWTSLWRVLTFVALVAVLYQGRQILLGLFLAIVISSGLESLVDILERVGIPRSVSVILIFLAALLLIILILYSVVPLVLVELNTIFSGDNKANLGGLGVLLNLQSQSITGALGKISGQFLASNTSPLDFLSGFFGNFGLAIAVIISSFYLSIGRDGVERFIEVVIPPDYEDRAMKIYRRARKLIGSWFRMQLLLSLIMGFTVWGGLTFLGVKYAFLIAALAAIFELVPFLGPILSGAAAVVSALMTSPTLAVYVLIFFLIAQQFESNILVPLLSRRSVGLHPVIVIVALLIGAEVGGLLGIIISVPAAAVFQEVIQEWSTKKRATGAAA